MNIFFGPEALVIVGEVLLLGGAIAVLVVSRRRNKRERELRQQIAGVLRENELADDLKNAYVSAEKVEELKKSEPVKTEFHDQEKIEPRGVLLRINVVAPLSTRSYLFDIRDKISIGESERNHLVLEDAGVEDVLCHLIMQDHRIYIKRISGKEDLEVLRGGQPLVLGEQLLALTDGDLIRAGRDRLELHFISDGLTIAG